MEQPTPRAAADATWHAVVAEHALAALASDPATGLSAAEAGQRLLRFGPNQLPEPPRPSALVRFFGQFKSPLIYLLLVAAGVAVALGEGRDAAVILIVILLNAIIGFAQEGRAEHALTALRRMAGRKARLCRDGGDLETDAGEVVPGDILLLAAGDAVAADARLVDGAALQIAEAALTGESLPVAKDQRPLAPDTPLADRRNMLYAGTHVTAGKARAVVVATGSSTEIGRIAAMTSAARPPPTPLEQRVDQLGRHVMIAAGALLALVIAVGLARGVRLGTIAMVGISQVVGMVPEGLPVAMTIALAVGVQRMARRRAIVRRLAAVETLGSTSVICTDKTGTLTRNEMTATSIVLPGREPIEVTGTGYAPAGSLRQADRTLSLDDDPELRGLIEAVLLCNDADVQGPTADEPRWRAIGDPTEAALVTLAIKAGVVPAELRARRPRLAEIPFDAATKMMATQHGAGPGGVVFLKGAPEELLELCGSLQRRGERRQADDAGRAEIRAAAEQLAGRALRVLAIAVVPGGGIDGELGFAAFRGRAVLLGLVGEIDPPRTEAAEAVARCRAAGIRPVMVTGDHPSTGLAIARALDIARDGDEAVDGRSLEAMSDEALGERVDRISVFARVHPAQKLRIVEAWQRRGAVVAMTGDGVNDAPALVRADVGVAMGLSGTEVAKEAAKIVIADDNFATIAAAVEEGRVVHRNIKKAVLLLATTSIAEVLVLLGAMLLGYPPPFAAVQILWNNLVTEGVITVNLIMDPAEGDEMRRPPVSSGEPLLTRALLTRIAFMTPAIVVSTLGWFVWRLGTGAPAEVARSEAFTLLVVCEWFAVLCCRSQTRSALDLGLFRNLWLVGGLLVGNLLQVAVIYLPPMNHVFHTVPIEPAMVLALGAAGSLVLWVDELRKLVVRHRLRASGTRTPPSPAIPCPPSQPPADPRLAADMQ